MGFACDFKNNDLSNVQIRSEDCGAAFWSTEECTHFAWSTYNGGTCWMTSGKVSKSDAFSTGDNTMVCGILEGIYLFILEKMTGGATGLLEINAVNGVEFTLIKKCPLLPLLSILLWNKFHLSGICQYVIQRMKEAKLTYFNQK